MVRASYCGDCGTTHKPGECPMADSPPPSRKTRAGNRTRVVGALSGKAADAWIKKMGEEVGGAQGNTLGHKKKRHYEKTPDPDSPGNFILELVEDE